MEGGDAVIPIINGLTVDEQRMASRLDEQLAAKRPRNRLRADFMDCKHLLTRLPPTIPPYLANVELTGTFGPAAVRGNLARMADMIVTRCWEARGAGALMVPTPSKFIFADDAALLEAIRSEQVSVAG